MDKNNLFKNMLNDNKVWLVGFIYLFIFIVAFTFKPSVITNNDISIDKVIYTETYNENNCNHEVIEELTEIIFDSSDITRVSNLTESNLRSILQGTNIVDLAPSIIKAEKEYGINAIFLASLLANNSNWGNSERAILYNNYSNMGVYNEKSIGFIYENKEDCVDSLSRLLSEEYLTVSGNYFEGYSIKDISLNYCNSDNWVKGLENIGNKLLKAYK